MSWKSEKVKRIFWKFDSNRDGGLNRDELAALMAAVNPLIEFSDAQFSAEVFLTYADFIDGDKGLTFDGLFRFYDDGAVDLDRDLDILGLNFDFELEIGGAWSTSIVPRTRAALLGDTVAFHQTSKLINNLDSLIQKLKSKPAKDRIVNSDKISELERSDKRDNRVIWEDSGANYTVFVKELAVLRSRADKDCSMEEAFDRHMAIGRVLYDYHLYNEALISFRKALDLQPTNAIFRFRAGNCLYQLGRHREAKEEFLQALVAAEVDRVKLYDFIPQIHVNLGIVLENEGMVFNACDHYRAACISRPIHLRALKYLGSALLAVGEYRAAIMTLQKVLWLRYDFADAHCDLGSALLAMNDIEKAIRELQKAIDLNPCHVDALYNLGGFYLDKGWYGEASVMFSKIITVWPNHWKAQLCKAVSLFGTGQNVEAKKALNEALKTVDRIELHDRLAYLKQLKKRGLKDNGSGAAKEAYLIVEPSKFKTVDKTSAFRLELANALDVWAFQKITGLSQCDVELLKRQMNENYVPVSYPGISLSEKTSLECILRGLLSFLKPESFVEAIKLINQKILSFLDRSNSDRVDLGLFFAVLAPLCRGPPDGRKRVAYHALLWRPGNEGNSRIRKTDAQNYIKLLRAIFISANGVDEMSEINGEPDTSMISLTEFLALFDDPDCGFGIMSSLLKLETEERNGSYVCATCRSAIIGSRFKEMKSHFSLCSHCYTEGKVPISCVQEEYIFREYAKSEAEAVKDPYGVKSHFFIN